MSLSAHVLYLLVLNYAFILFLLTRREKTVFFYSWNHKILLIPMSLLILLTDQILYNFLFWFIITFIHFYSSHLTSFVPFLQVSSYCWRCSVSSMVPRRNVCGLWETVTCWVSLQEEYGKLCSAMRPTLCFGENAKASPKSPLTLKWCVVVPEI